MELDGDIDELNYDRTSFYDVFQEHCGVLKRSRMELLCKQCDVGLKSRMLSQSLPRSPEGVSERTTIKPRYLTPAALLPSSNNSKSLF
jgi:hypothetical protein